MKLKIFHEDSTKIDNVYQNWTKTFKGREVNVVSFSSNSAYGKTTLTVQYTLVDKED
jgi:hypothetical protein